jgi:predicted alpha-1,2-mannosidase
MNFVFRSPMLPLVFSLALCCPLCGCRDDDGDDDHEPADDDAGDDDDDDDNDDNDTADDDASPADLLDYVDPLIGTGSFGTGYAASYPGPSAPFGMIGVSPDTTMYGVPFDWLHYSGYYYPDPQIRGFTHTHMHGTGLQDYGNILIMPMNRKPAAPIGEATFRSRFSHANETAKVGYYRVRLDDPQVVAELTATDWAAMHRYTWQGRGEPYVVVDPSYSLDAGWVSNATVTIDPSARMVYGLSNFSGGLTGKHPGGTNIYYAVQFSQPFTTYGTWKDGQPTDGNLDEEGENVGTYFGFAAGDEPLLIRVGVSFQSVVQAQANLAARAPDWDFAGMAKATRDAWRQYLGRIEVTGGTTSERRVFYTALYHTGLMPHDWTETNNRYLGFDGLTHDAGTRRYYTDLSLWDTFRTFHPLMNLIDPARNADFLQSLVLMYEQGGSIPKWPAGLAYTDCMSGTSADIVFADAYLKGNRDFDFETAYEGCYAHATGDVPNDGRPGLDFYLTLGYVPEDQQLKGVSHTLEYCYDDAALSWWATAMNKPADAAMFLERSHNYRNYWDAETGFLRPRNSDGSWVTPFQPLYSFPFDEHYVEGDAWHYTFYVPHDVAGLAALFGSAEALVEKLNFAFERNEPLADFNWLPGPYLWLGNEPSLFHPYLFAFAGRPDLTQKWIRWVLLHKFRDGPDGLPGNDDCGTMSAFYIFSALGFFPQAGSDRYVLGSPVFDRVTLHLPNGELVITAANNGPDHVYVQAATLNGEPLTTPFFAHDRIANGGTLEFVLGPIPADDSDHDEPAVLR